MRAASLAIGVILAIACSSPSKVANRGSTSPTPSTGVYLGSLGSPACKPGAAFHGQLPEAGFDSSRGSLWALFFNSVPPPAGKDLKVV